MVGTDISKYRDIEKESPKNNKKSIYNENFGLIITKWIYMLRIISAS